MSHATVPREQTTPSTPHRRRRRRLIVGVIAVVLLLIAVVMIPMVLRLIDDPAASDPVVGVDDVGMQGSGFQPPVIEVPPGNGSHMDLRRRRCRAQRRRRRVAIGRPGLGDVSAHLHATRQLSLRLHPPRRHGRTSRGRRRMMPSRRRRTHTTLKRRADRQQYPHQREPAAPTAQQCARKAPGRARGAHDTTPRRDAAARWPMPRLAHPCCVHGWQPEQLEVHCPRPPRGCTPAHRCCALRSPEMYACIVIKY